MINNIIEWYLSQDELVKIMVVGFFVGIIMTIIFKISDWLDRNKEYDQDL